MAFSQCSHDNILVTPVPKEYTLKIFASAGSATRAVICWIWLTETSATDFAPKYERPLPRFVLQEISCSIAVVQP